jgi:UDP-GlcNAc:undecaprenyl-phosphate GlcNAc-1-phosphate transferase
MLEPGYFLYLIIFFASLALAVVLVPYLRKTAFRLNFVDLPNQDHKTHLEPVPYLGGFSIVVPFILLCALGSFYMDGTIHFTRTALFLVPSTIMAAVGFLDDFLNLPAKLRFVVQLATSIIVSILLILNGFTSKLTGNHIVDFFLSVLWIVGITNAFNLIDNVDGGAAGVTAVSSIALFFLGVMSGQYLISMASICLSGASMGFLYWNKNPARIYLGDGGALFIGTVIAILFLQFEPEAESLIASVAIPILVLAVPIVDTSVVVTSRLAKGLSIFQGGRDHISHRLQNLGYSKSETALILWLLCSFFSIMGLILNLLEGSAENYLSIASLGMLASSYIYFLRLSAQEKSS